MSYLTAEHVASLAASLPRNTMGVYEVLTRDGKLERTTRAEIAVMLKLGHTGHTRSRTPPSPGHAAALARSARALAAASAILGRSSPPGTRPALTTHQRAAVDSLGNSDLIGVIGEAMAHEMAARDKRIRSLEARMPVSPEGLAASRARARAAVARAEALL